MFNRATALGLAQSLLREGGWASQDLNVLLLLLDALALVKECRVIAPAYQRALVWFDYAREAYHADATSSWNPPLPVDGLDLGALLKLSESDDLLYAARQLSQRCLDKLQERQVWPTQDISSDDLIEELLASEERIFAPYDPTFCQTISNTLRSKRQSRSPDSHAPVAATFRAVLSHLLQHHFGSEHFGPPYVAATDGNVLWYALDAEDDRAIARYFDAPARQGHRTSHSDSEHPLGSPFSHDRLADRALPPRFDSRARISVDIESLSSRDDTQSILAPSSSSIRSTRPLLRPQSLFLVGSNSNGTHTGQRSPGPFEDSLVPVLAPFCSETNIDQLRPKTSNSLSPEERRELVRRSKKLNQILGRPMNEQTAERTLVIQTRSPLSPSLVREIDEQHSPVSLRRQSYPPSNPPSPQYARSTSHYETLYASPDFSSASMSRSSSGHTPDTRPVTPQDLSPSHDPLDQPRDVKEERRRRVQKVYALLGEIVPQGLITGSDPLDLPDVAVPAPLPVLPPPPTQAKHARSGSRFMGMLKRKPRDSPHLPELSGSFSDDEVVRIRKSPNPASFNSAPEEVTFDSIRRARKLERYFGELPPQYLRRGTGASRTSLDQDVTIVEDFIESPPPTPVGSEVPALLGSRRGSVLSSKSSKSSLRHQSLDAIQLLAETRPQQLADHLWSVYGPDKQETPLPETPTDSGLSAGDTESPNDVKLGHLSFYSTGSRASYLSGTASSRNSGFTPDLNDVVSPTSPSFRPLERSSSLSRQHSNGRQIKQGLKLTNFFGTSEVLNHVLERVFEDLEKEEEGDEDVTAEERAQFLARSQQLRKQLLH